MTKLAEQLAENRFFTGKSPSQIETLLQRMPGRKTNDFRRGEIIAELGALFPYMGFVLDGSVDIQRPLITGNTLYIQVKTRGDMFSGATVFSGHPPYSPCDIIGRKPGRVLLIPGKEISGVATSDPVIAGNVFRIFAGRVLAYKQRVELLSYPAIKKKIAYYLTRQMQEVRSSTIVLPFTKSKWAEYLNVSRPSLLRELKALENTGMVTVHKETIHIQDTDALERLLLN